MQGWMTRLLDHQVIGWLEWNGRKAENQDEEKKKHSARQRATNNCARCGLEGDGAKANKSAMRAARLATREQENEMERLRCLTQLRTSVARTNTPMGEFMAWRLGHLSQVGFCF